VFTCHDISVFDTNQFAVRWFKNDVQIATHSSKIQMFDELLFIGNVSHMDVGEYHCQTSSIDGVIQATSPKKKLSLVGGMSFFCV